MSLDCNTERGRMFIDRQNDILSRCAERWLCLAIRTCDSRESPVDALFSRNGVLSAVGEVKARDMSLGQLREFGSYLVTHRKIKEGAALALSLCVPYILVVGLYAESVIVWWKITNSDGKWLIKPDVRRTLTQETCNGGKVERDNAYLPLDNMSIIQ